MEETGERFYYFSITTTGEALAPVFSAWSVEALDRVVAEQGGGAELRDGLKWSYADSPYFDYRNDLFHEVNELFEARPKMDYMMEDEAWKREFDLRLEAMEEAVVMLDSDGVFGSKTDRNEVMITVEIMPPDESNVQRAYRLNPPEAIEDWLREEWGIE